MENMKKKGQLPGDQSLEQLGHVRIKTTAAPVIAS
jgi:hypothetical protein